MEKYRFLYEKVHGQARIGWKKHNDFPVDHDRAALTFGLYLTADISSRLFREINKVDIVRS